jgi:predicted nucleotide-binding protein (sugar kinase/HSP70/actin superfamily)
MITIGLPKGLFYFDHHILWEHFFIDLGCSVVTSRDTNRDIMDYGVKFCSNETCLPVKVFHGHVYYLKNIVDYIFIPRYTSVYKNEYTCPKFCGLPDMVIFNLKRQVKVLEIKIHPDKFPSWTFDSLEAVSKLLGIKYTCVLNTFKKAVSEYHRHIWDRFRENSYIINSENSKAVIPVLGHPYMIYDSYLSMNLIDKLEKRNFSVYTPRDICREIKRENAYPFQGKVFWYMGFELLGSAFTFTQDKNVKGLVYLTPFSCGVDAFIVEFMERHLYSRYRIPLLKLMVDEHTGEAGFDTRLEAFLDTVG